MNLSDVSGEAVVILQREDPGPLLVVGIAVVAVMEVDIVEYDVDTYTRQLTGMEAFGVASVIGIQPAGWEGRGGGVVFKW